MNGWGFRRLRSLLLVILAIGIGFRFFHLDHKVYWYDETQTSLRISGHIKTEFVEEVFNGRVISVGELLQQYQYPNPDKTLTDAMRALSGNPEHSPLYFLLARFWLQFWGNSIATIRSLSAIISLLSFPALYWLCLELFASKWVAAVAVALLAISPFHVLYAQEAREYSLWTVTILLSCATLLRALRLQTLRSWGSYAIAVALGLYTHPFSVFVMASHGLYVAFITNWAKVTGTARDRVQALQSLIRYLLATLAGVGLFAPWLWVILQNFSQFADNTRSVSNPMPDLVQRWFLNLSRIFFDLNQGPSWINPVIYLLAGLVIYAVVYLCRHTPRRTWLFVLTLMGVLGLALLVPDIVLGGRRSNNARYIIPCILGIQIAVAYLLTSKLTALTDNRHQRYWRSTAIALLISGILSCAVSSQMPVWWHKSYAKSRYNPAVAEVVNQSLHPGDRPLVVAIASEETLPGQILSFIHLLDPQVQLQLIHAPQIPTIPATFKSIFLYRPTEALRQGLATNFKLTPVYKTWLWQATGLKP
ncbi:glycosyltransferase family 39 protein [Pantanalinema sp. GBBB05]|uniref:glycosyltransferase family 39 protein n=1 Tax=Pantanalinema sp. GBBB05 TaxID=2604139 RepID=UPI001D6AC92C|nr:dolichyl-phosphate-mannose-protein mannosyltransferase [Pantanalinema sp. GBBB05]